MWSYYSLKILKFFIFCHAVSAETIQKNLEQIGRQIKSLQKDLETFPPAQNENDHFVEKMSISFVYLI